jgi:hypothetical protein
MLSHIDRPNRFYDWSDFNPDYRQDHFDLHYLNREKPGRTRRGPRYGRAEKVIDHRFKLEQPLKEPPERSPEYKTRTRHGR